MRLTSCFVLLFGLCAGLFAASPVRAELIGDTKVPYSADRTVVTGGKTYVGRIYAIPGRQRHEQVMSGLSPVAILRGDQRLAWLLLPDLKIYTDFRFPAAVTEIGDRSQLGTPLGAETVGGQRATKYKIEHHGSDGSALNGFVWLTADGIPMRLTGTYTSTHGKPIDATLELSNLKLGPQPAALFELPQGMQKLPPEALEPLLGKNVTLPHKS